MKEMKLSIEVTFSESQKAQIVSRGEALRSRYTFEMSRKYAATISKLAGHSRAYQVSDEGIEIIMLDELYVAEYLDVRARVYRHGIEQDFCNAITDGSLQDGASCDAIMQKIETLVAAKDAARETAIKRNEAARLQKEREKPARERAEKEEARKKAERDEANAAQRIADEKAAAEQQAEKVSWIRQHGSERLRKGIEQGYSCQKIYITERGSYELGEEYILDFYAELVTNKRSCPTLAALDEVERLSKAGIQSEIKFMPYGFEFKEAEYDCARDTFPCEAVEVILLENYFYKKITQNTQK